MICRDKLHRDGTSRDLSSVRMMLPEVGEASKRRDLIVSVGISREIRLLHAHDRWRTALVLAGKDSTVSEFEPVTSGGRRRQERRGKSDDD